LVFFYDVSSILSRHEADYWYQQDLCGEKHRRFAGTGLWLCAKKGAVKKLVMLVFMMLWSHDVFAVGSAATPLVAVHPAVPVDHLSQAQLRSIFLKRQVIWPDGVAIKVFILPVKSATHRQFSQSHLQMFPYQLDRAWQKLTFSGIGTPPAEVSSAAEMLKLLQSTPGAIGYLPADNETTDAKIIQIKP